MRAKGAVALGTSWSGRVERLGLDTFTRVFVFSPLPTLPLETLRKQESSLCTPPPSCLTGDDSSTCIGILAKEVEIVASSDSSISSKARGSNKVGTTTLWHVWWMWAQSASRSLLPSCQFCEDHLDR